MIIRRETPQDIDAIYRLTADAFAPLAMSDGSEPDIINGLRDNGALRVSLVAEEDGKIVGHGALSPVTIKGHSNWFGLGPIAVHPERQKQGIGSALMKHALAELEAIDACGCVLVGNPDYYRRFGFASNGALTYFDTPTKYVQFVVLRGSEPRGEIGYDDAFGGA
ncbi:putative acetyltransferase [Planktotalea frisia]|jgi:putative acetyltransferase|uniref:Acetyltransferase n=1 Tax=Planktotalea frisia TaxID=696762 RepID=A0A1L9NXN9_9RHOB|nr:N-acetyltransferase [Planktotalea frisia]OJI93924.1 acetyltransferase [Planktotalea frisia]PZX35249.1 putative acetyltransferase [Planktotalea frisia]